MAGCLSLEAIARILGVSYYAAAHIKGRLKHKREQNIKKCENAKVLRMEWQRQIVPFFVGHGNITREDIRRGCDIGMAKEVDSTTDSHTCRAQMAIREK